MVNKKSIATAFFLVGLLMKSNVSIAHASTVCAIEVRSVQNSTTVVPGGEITYSFSIKNTGTGFCTDVRFSAYYDENETYVRSAPLSTKNTNYYWYIGTLRGGQTTSIQVTTKTLPLVSGQIVNEACVSSNEGDDSCASSVTTISTNSSPGGTPIAPKPIPAPIPTPTPVPPTPTSTPVVVQKEYGVWVWDSPYSLSSDASKRVIDNASFYGFRQIYITIDDYLEIVDMPNGVAKTNALKAYTTSLEQFISYANQKKIAVDVEAGWRDWAKPEYRYKAYAILSYAISYNSTHSLKIRNVQYDVEPYILPEYENNKVSVLTDFITFTNELVSRQAGNVGITMVIPHFYDASQAWTPSITYKGKTAATFTHLLDALDQKSGNNIILMAYRNYAEGAGGTIDISKSEISEASSSNHSTKIMVAQETGNVDPSYVTFYGMTKADLVKQISSINSAFTNASAFGGISVHYLDPFLKLQ